MHCLGEGRSMCLFVDTVYNGVDSIKFALGYACTCLTVTTILSTVSLVKETNLSIFGNIYSSGHFGFGADTSFILL